jgi:hypothetical protein
MYSFLGPQVQEWALFEEIIAERLHQECHWTCCRQRSGDNSTELEVYLPGEPARNTESVGASAVPDQQRDASLTSDAGDFDTDAQIQAYRLELARLQEQKRQLYKELKQLILQEQRATTQPFKG